MHASHTPNCPNWSKSVRMDRKTCSLSCFGWTDPLTAWVFKDLKYVSTRVHVQHSPELGQAEPFDEALCFRWVDVEMLHCTQLHSDNFNTYTPAHTNMSWHTYWLLCTKWAYARWNAHTELLWTFPSNVYASATIKTRQTAMWDRLNLLPLYVGREYANGRLFFIVMCASCGWACRCLVLPVCALYVGI